MFATIKDMLDNRFSGPRGLMKYDANGIHIVNAIEKLFQDENFERNQFSVMYDILLSCSDYSIGYVSVAYIDRGVVHHNTYNLCF